MSTPKLLYTVEEACEATGIRRSLLYELVQRGEIPTRTIGRRRLFPVAALERWAEGRDDEFEAVQASARPRRIA